MRRYLALSTPSVSDIINRFLTFFLLNASFVPVSLYVSMKVARQAQKIFMQFDETCVYKDEKLFRASNGAEGVFPLQARAAARVVTRISVCGRVAHGGAAYARPSFACAHGGVLPPA